jgi:hypothetical protein
MSGPRNQKPGAAHLCPLTTGPTYQRRRSKVRPKGTSLLISSRNSELLSRVINMPPLPDLIAVSRSTCSACVSRRSRLARSGAVTQSAVGVCDSIICIPLLAAPPVGGLLSLLLGSRLTPYPPCPPRHRHRHLEFDQVSFPASIVDPSGLHLLTCKCSVNRQNGR